MEHYEELYKKWIKEVISTRTSGAEDLLNAEKGVKASIEIKEDTDDEDMEPRLTLKK